MPTLNVSETNPANNDKEKEKEDENEQKMKRFLGLEMELCGTVVQFCC